MAMNSSQLPMPRGHSGQGAAPTILGTRGSGMIFLSGGSPGCISCPNHPITQMGPVSAALSIGLHHGCKQGM